MARRALISTDDLRRMAKVAAEFGVKVRGNLDPLGNFTVLVDPSAPVVSSDDDDLDARLDKYCSR